MEPHSVAVVCKLDDFICCFLCLPVHKHYVALPVSLS